jgi:uncharacterized membrane protein HdeD (DUF308 family)
MGLKVSKGSLNHSDQLFPTQQGSEGPPMKKQTENQLSIILSRSWTMMLLRGLTAILFGVLVCVLPEVSVKMLVYLFGAFVLIDGIVGTWTAIAVRKDYDDWVILLLWALVGNAVGILAFVKPSVITMALLFFIALWAVMTGLLEIVVAIRLRREIADGWLLIVGGLLSVAFGFLLLVQPQAGAVAMIWLIGTYAVVFGFVLVILAFKIRKVITRLLRNQGPAVGDTDVMRGTDQIS